MPTCRRRLSKAWRRSNRLRRTYDQIKQLRARATRRSLDWAHKTSTELADTFGVIGVEDLAIANMVKSAKGTMEAPGTNVRQKAGLNRSISGEAWGRVPTDTNGIDAK
ncbi:transposase [Streptomyces sp. NPDC005046]